jgi:hypothetical protein
LSAPFKLASMQPLGGRSANLFLPLTAINAYAAKSGYPP